MHLRFVGMQSVSVQHTYPAGYVGGLRHIGWLKPTFRAEHPDVSLGGAGRRSALAHRWHCRLAPSVSSSAQ